MMSEPTRKRILFVDDEPLVLQGLQRMLRSMRTEWDMVFVESGVQALARMEAEPFDVVVSDMRMPGMNGAELMRQLLERYPQVVRIILSGHADRELIAQCLGTAHQYLSKPCDPEALKSLVARACALGGDIGDNRVKALLGGIQNLPTVPQVYVELSEALKAEQTSATELGRIMARDMGMTAKVLKLVNSAFFGLRRELSNPMEAVNYLGIETVRSLVLLHGVFDSLGEWKAQRLKLERIWSHGLLVALGARSIAQLLTGEEQLHEAAFTGGLLHDVGILVLAINFPERYDEALAQTERERGFFPLVEQRVFGANHAEVGAYLMALWGLPDGVVDCIRYHHTPLVPGASGSVPLLAIHLADALLMPMTFTDSMEHGLMDPDVLHHPLIEGRMESIQSALKSHFPMASDGRL